VTDAKGGSWFSAELGLASAALLLFCFRSLVNLSRIIRSPASGGNQLLPSITDGDVLRSELLIVMILSAFLIEFGGSLRGVVERRTGDASNLVRA